MLTQATGCLSVSEHNNTYAAAARKLFQNALKEIIFWRWLPIRIISGASFTQWVLKVAFFGSFNGRRVECFDRKSKKKYTKGPSTLATLFNHMWPRIVAGIFIPVGNHYFQALASTLQFLAQVCHRLWLVPATDRAFAYITYMWPPHVALLCSGPPQGAATCGWTKWPVCSGPKRNDHLEVFPRWTFIFCTINLYYLGQLIKLCVNERFFNNTLNLLLVFAIKPYKTYILCFLSFFSRNVIINDQHFIRIRITFHVQS